MFLKRMDPAHFEEAYGILVQEVYPWAEAAATPFGAVWAIVEPGKRTKHHNHQEGETFFVASGRGSYRVGDEVVEVRAGDVVFQPPFNSHVIENTSETENLVFLSVYWEDLNLWDARQAAALFQGERPERVLVTAEAAVTEITAEGDVPLAALAGDILARYLRLRGADASLALAEADAAAGGDAGYDALGAMNIEADRVLRPRDPEIRRRAEELFRRLDAAGALVEREGQLWFPLSRFAGELREHYLKAGMSARQRAFLEEASADGFPDVAVTRSGGGIPVPAAGFDGRSLSDCLEAAARALAARGATAADESLAVVDCFGGGDLFLHGLAVPALLLAFDPALHPAAAFVMNEEGRGSSGLTPGRPADLVRFYLASTWPESEPADWSAADLAATVERELAGTWQPWLSELGAKLAEERGGEIPATGDWMEDHRRFYARLQELLAEAAAGYEPRSFSPQQAMRACGELVRTARRFGKAEAHWRKVPARSEERRTGLALELLAAKALALAAAPVMPDFAGRLWRDLGYETPFAEARWEDRPAWLPSGQRLRGLGRPYFAAASEAAAIAVPAPIAAIA
jgi:mannose-6-phosphate isomerase-like protein (cupin superfamily)